MKDTYLFFLDFLVKEYLKRNGTERLKLLLNDVTGIKSATTLLLKRTAFSHEEEVRAIYNTVGEKNKARYGKVLPFTVVPPEFIEEICFDPRMLPVFDKEKQKLLDRGVTIPIVCSTLYAPLEHFLKE